MVGSSKTISLTTNIENTSLELMINNTELLRENYLSYIEVNGISYFKYLEKSLKQHFSDDEIVEYFVRVAKKGIQTNEFKINKTM